MKKLYTLALLVLLSLSLCLCAACGSTTTQPSSPESSPAAPPSASDASASLDESTPENGGCAHEEHVEPAVEPTCTESGWSEGRYCTKCGEVFAEQTEIPSPGHSYTDGACTACGKLQPSEGLEFHQNNNEYAVIGMGSCTDSRVVIPESYNGRAVTMVDKNAFAGSSIEALVIPEGVVSIAADAFKGCTKLESVTLPASLLYVSENAFDGCTALTELSCAAASQPAGWSAQWLGSCTATVTWGKTN